MTEAQEGQNVAVEQQTASTSQDVSSQQSEATDLSSANSQEQINKDSSQLEVGKPDPELAKERFKESNEKRKKELEDLRKKFEEQKEQLEQEKAERQKYQQLMSNPIGEDEIYDELLGEIIPRDISVPEYKQRLETKHKKQQEEQALRDHQRKEAEFISGVQENLNLAKEKNPNVERVLQNAVADGLIDVSMFRALADKRAGWDEKGLLFLSGLVESNPQELRKIMTQCPTDEAKAAAIGKLSAKYFDKPVARANALPEPIEPLSDRGSKDPNRISLENTDDGYRQRKLAYMARKR